MKKKLKKVVVASRIIKDKVKMKKILALDKLERIRVLNRTDKVVLRARKRKVKRKYQFKSLRMICSVRV